MIYLYCICFVFRKNVSRVLDNFIILGRWSWFLATADHLNKFRSTFLWCLSILFGNNFIIKGFLLFQCKSIVPRIYDKFFYHFISIKPVYKKTYRELKWLCDGERWNIFNSKGNWSKMSVQWDYLLSLLKQKCSLSFVQ